MIYSFVVMEREDQLQTEKCESECLQCQWVRGLSDRGRLSVTDTSFTADSGSEASVWNSLFDGRSFISLIKDPENRIPAVTIPHGLVWMITVICF